MKVDEEEPSAKQRLIGTLNSTDEFWHLGFFSSGIEDQKGDQENDEFFLDTIEDYCVEDKEIENLVNQFNLLAMDRDKAINSELSNAAGPSLASFSRGRASNGRSWMRQPETSRLTGSSALENSIAVD